jgi:DNA repair exonuclease SbcCD ATPase subunit
MRRSNVFLAGLASMLAMLLGMVRVAAARPQLHDYLSEEEAGKIRDATTPSERIKLYMSFAEDRLQKFTYELNRTAPERDQSQVLNGLLHAYEGCMDDASDEIDDARRTQSDIKEALKFMNEKSKSFLSQLQKYSKSGRHLGDYSDTLQDAIDSTTDAISDVADAQKTMLPAVVRRKQ